MRRRQPRQPLDAAVERRIDLPAAALERSLAALAREFGITLALDPALAAGRAAPVLAGSFSARDAFARLLAGTGLAIAARADGSFALVRATAAAQAGERVLAPIHVAATPWCTRRSRSARRRAKPSVATARHRPPTATRCAA